MAMIGGVGQVALYVTDLERAVAFYRDTVGLRHLFTAPPGLAFFDAGNVRLLVERPADERFRPPSSVLYYRVDDLDAAHAALSGRGVTVASPPHLVAKLPDHDLWMAFYEDGEGNVFALMREVRPPVPA